jgi:hypothetical protein
MNNTLLFTKGRNILIFEYFVVFVLTIYAGNASKFVGALENWDNPIGFILPIFLVTLLAYERGVWFNHKYLLLLFGFTVYFVASTLMFGQLHPRFFGILVIKFTIAYIVISALGFRFFSMYEDIVYYLCIIGIVFWIISNIIPTQFTELLRHFEFSNQGPVKGNVDFNTIVYTVGNVADYPNVRMNFGGFSIFRNAGFAWEPGIFASLINVATLFNLIRSKFTLKGNNHFWIFQIALASTFSTTGYSLFLLLMLFYIFNKDIVKAIWLVPVIVIATFFLFTLPFMSEKISENMEYDTEQLIYDSAKYGIVYQPQRFQSLQMDFIDFLNHPLIGYGGHLEATWTNQLGAQIYTVSGIGKIMAQFGVVGIIFFLFSLWQSSKRIITLHNIRGIIFPVLFILLYAISYSVFTILMMSIWLLYLSNFLKTEVIRKYTIHRILKNINAQKKLD